MSEIDDLEAAFCAAQRARVALEQERYEARSALIAEVDAQIARQFAERIAAAWGTENAARRALDDGKVRAAHASNADMFTSVLVKWKNQPSRPLAQDWAMRPTNQRGRYEIRGAASEFAANKTYGIPEFGEKFVRFLKKDGSPGLGFERTAFSSSVWLPEGEKPVGSALP